MPTKRQKGAAFEREVCRDLSLWLTRGKRADVFWRSAMSGGRATLMRSKGRLARAQAGDIVATSEEGYVLTDSCFIECKFYRDLQMVGLYLGLEGGINKFWSETLEEARQHHKWPFLIAKQNRAPTFCLLTRDGVNFFGLNHLVLAHFLQIRANVLWYDDFLKFAKRPA